MTLDEERPVDLFDPSKLLEAWHGMGTEAQRIMIEPGKSEADRYRGMIALLRGSADTLERDAMTLEEQKTTMAKERWTIEIIGTAETFNAVWTGAFYVDERDRSWSPVGPLSPDRVVVKLQSFDEIPRLAMAHRLD